MANNTNQNAVNRQQVASNTTQNTANRQQVENNIAQVPNNNQQIVNRQNTVNTPSNLNYTPAPESQRIKSNKPLADFDAGIATTKQVNM